MGMILLAIFMGLWTVANWVYELKIWLKSKPMDIPEGAGTIERWKFRMYGFKYHFNNFKYFTLDLIVSWLSITLFAFGESFVAGIMGMLFSNLLSIIIIIRMNVLKKHKEHPDKQHNYEHFNQWKAACKA